MKLPQVTHPTRFMESLMRGKLIRSCCIAVALSVIAVPLKSLAQEDVDYQPMCQDFGGGRM